MQADLIKCKERIFSPHAEKSGDVDCVLSLSALELHCPSVRGRQPEQSLFDDAIGRVAKSHSEVNHPRLFKKE
jgi:hypothetical protein